MGSTNLTPNYELSQFIGTDKPAWLQDYNGDMLKIDTGIAGAKTAADNAQSAADGAQGDATTALNSIADINIELGTVENTLSTATGNINTINSLIGNGTPTTTDKTLIGAINELHADYLDLAQNSRVQLGSVTVIGDGVKTRAEIINELLTGFIAHLRGLGANDRCIALKTNILGFTMNADIVILNNSANPTLEFKTVVADSTSFRTYTASSNGTTAVMNKIEILVSDGSITHGDPSTAVIGSGTEIVLQYEDFIRNY